MHAWEDFLKTQETELGKATVNKWLKSLKVLKYDACNLYLEANDSFQAMWFEEHLRTKLNLHFKNNNNKKIKVHLKLRTIQPPKKKHKKKEKALELFSNFSIQFDQLNPYATFDQWIATEDNELPSKLSQNLAGFNPQEKELCSFNPIFFYGKAGSGKSHLLMALTHALRKQGKNALYCRAETFTEHVVSAIRAGEIRAFRKVYRKADILLVDNVQIFGRKSATQEEFFHTFNTLHLQNHQIIISADCSPQELQNIEPRLISRFEWGITLPLLQLEREERKQMVINKSEHMNFKLNEEIIDFLVDTFSRHPGVLAKALEALTLRIHMQILSSAQLTLLLAQDILKDMIQKEEEYIVTPDKIIKTVAEHFGIRIEDVKSKSQSRECVLPRQIAMFLCRQELKMPYMRIGEVFSRDHSTVMSSIRIIQQKLDKYFPEISGIQKKLQPAKS